MTHKKNNSIWHRVKNWLHRSWYGYRVRVPLDVYSHMLVYKFGDDWPTSYTPPSGWVKVPKVLRRCIWFASVWIARIMPHVFVAVIIEVLVAIIISSF